MKADASDDDGITITMASKRTPSTPARPEEPTTPSTDGSTAAETAAETAEPIDTAEPIEHVEPVLVGPDADEVPDELAEHDDEDDDDRPAWVPAGRTGRSSTGRAADQDDDRTGPGIGVRIGAEALGTFALVLVIVGVALYNPLSQAGSVGLALAGGLVLAGLTAALGHVSGGHFNPAVSFASAVAGRTSWADLPLYWLGQLLGAVAAAAAVFLTIPSELPALIGGDPAAGAGGTVRSFMGGTANGWGEQSPLFDLAGGQVTFDLRGAVIVEVLAAAVLAAVYLGVTHRRSLGFSTERDARNARHGRRDLHRATPLEANRSHLHRSAPLAIGLTYAALLMLTAPITNGSLNPARSTAAALFSEPEALRQLWLFWVAPLVGAAIVGLVYRAVIEPSDAEYADDEDDEDDDERSDDTELLVERH